MLNKKITWAEPEPEPPSTSVRRKRLRRSSYEPLQVQQSSNTRNVVVRCPRYPPLSQPLPPVYHTSSSRTGCSRRNSLPVYPSSLLSLPALYHQHRSRNPPVSSTRLPPTPMPLPPPVSRPLARRESCPDLSDVVVQAMELADATGWELERQVRDCIVLACGQDVYDALLRTLDQVITLIDEGLFRKEKDFVFADSFREDDRYQAPRGLKKTTPRRKNSVAAYFSKVYLYYNSRLPAHLPPLRLSNYTPTYTLLRLAAQYSLQVYEKPIGSERQCYIDSDWRRGTKAMVIKSIPLDDMNAIVFAIRGTQSFRDWAINMKTEPTSPDGFLDDPDNLCHAGFLSVARKMVAPVAARLRSLLAEDPNRIAHSLIITGHSAGGAVGSLLFCHMLSEYVGSELTPLRRFFKRVHCVTFGAPPVSLRPLQLPSWNSLSPIRSMFFAFINEGDPVPRAEKSYIVSLLDLYSSPASKVQGRRKPVKWRVPRATLSAAGRLVVLRKKQTRNPFIYALSRPEVEACIVTQEQLRGVVFGDPLMHTMDLYARRIDELARNAVHYSPCLT